MLRSRVEVLQTTQNLVSFQPVRFRGKINIQKPKPFHHERGKVMEFITPFFPNPNKGKPLWEVCELPKELEMKKKQKEVNPYEMIIAREVRDWFNNSKMIGIYHKNSITAEEDFNFRVNLKRQNMCGKTYGKKLLMLALKDTIYSPILSLFEAPTILAFSPEVNVTALQKASRKTPQVILMAGIVEGKLLSRNEFLELRKIDLMSARTQLVLTLKNAGGASLNRYLTQQSSNLVRILKQIGTTESSCDKKD